jgi:hypothetical protein
MCEVHVAGGLQRRGDLLQQEDCKSNMHSTISKSAPKSYLGVTVVAYRVHNVDLHAEPIQVLTDTGRR